jgi:hypothetical protein
VRLAVDTDRRLKADLLLSVDPANSLKARPTGLYAKQARRKYLFSLVTSLTISSGTPTGAVPLAASTLFNQPIPFTNELYDADGVWSGAAAPTKITYSEAGRYWIAGTLNVVGVGGHGGTAWQSQLMVLKNGSQYVTGQQLFGALAAGITQVRSSFDRWGFEVVAGDYLELVWRDVSHAAATATSYLGWAAIQGGAILA